MLKQYSATIPAGEEVPTNHKHLREILAAHARKHGRVDIRPSDAPWFAVRQRGYPVGPAVLYLTAYGQPNSMTDGILAMDMHGNFTQVDYTYEVEVSPRDILVRIQKILLEDLGACDNNARILSLVEEYGKAVEDECRMRMEGEG